MKKRILSGILSGLFSIAIISCDDHQREFSSLEPEQNLISKGIEGSLVVYPSPGNLSTVEHLKQSNDYTVEVRKTGEIAYKSCFVYKTDNYWVDKYFGGAGKPQVSASFTSFAFDGSPVDVKITFSSTAKSVTIRPLNFGINAVRTNNVITFTLQDPKKLSIEINDRTNPLFLFAEKPDVPNTTATYYYGPGVHNIGLQKKINTNESVYIAAGAVVEGSFVMPYDSKNISIKGRGILTMGQWPHESVDIDFLQSHSAIRSNGTSFLQLEGIIIANSCGWTIPIYNSDNLTHDNQFRNLKLISWNGNTDGIWINGDKNVVDDCFIFNNDDIFMSHGATNSKISNCIVWGGPWGRLYWLGPQKSTSDIVFDNINVIGKDGGPAMILVDGTSGVNLNVNNVTFRNIRVEEHPKTNSYSTNKFLVFNSTHKSVNNWLFENITIDDKNPDEGDLFGTANSLVKGIKFKNFTVGGQKATILSDVNMDKNEFATDIQFQ